MSSRSIGVIGAGIIGTVIACFLKRATFAPPTLNMSNRAAKSCDNG